MTIGNLVLMWWFPCFLYASGSFYAFAQGEFRRIADRSRRQDIGASIFIGTVAGVLGPVGVFVVACLTGLNQHGWKFPGNK
jgi:uncharacterized membrane protein YfcA